MRRGFIPLVVMAIIGLVSALTAGGAYTVYKVNELQKENEAIKTELQEQKQEVEEEVVTEVASTTEEEVEATTTTEVVVEAEEKEVSVPLRATPSVQPVVVDVCLNITGVQPVVPAGYTSSLNVCTEINQKDYCANLSGIQSAIPSGMMLDKSYGCIDEDELDAIFDAKQKEENHKEYCEETKLGVQRLSQEALDIRYNYDIKIQETYSSGGGLQSGVNAQVSNLQRQMNAELTPIEYERDSLNLEYVQNCT